MNTANKPEIASLIVKCYLFWVDSVFQIFVSHNKPKEVCNVLRVKMSPFLSSGWSPRAILCSLPSTTF